MLIQEGLAVVERKIHHQELKDENDCNFLSVGHVHDKGMLKDECQGNRIYYLLAVISRYNDGVCKLAANHVPGESINANCCIQSQF